MNVSSPNTLQDLHTSDLAELCGQAMVNLEEYLHSWSFEEGLGGVISTWWSSSLKERGAHPMNQAPYLLGLSRRYGRSPDESLQLRMMLEVNSLRSNVMGDGILKNGWGDLPDAPKAPVIGMAAVSGLYGVFDVLKDDSIFETAEEIRVGYVNRYASGNTFSHTVSNQNLRWSLTCLQRYLITGDQADLDTAVLIADNVLKQQIGEGNLRGAIYQSKYSDILINVYCGKCLYPLVALFQHTGEMRFIESAERLAQYIVRNLTEQSLVSGGWQPATTTKYKVTQKLSALDRRLMNDQMNADRLRRSSIKEWKKIEAPVFIARFADTVRGLAALANYKEEYLPIVEQLVRSLIKSQYANGGFANTIGYRGASVSWQDVIPSTRWNVYVYQLLVDMFLSKSDQIMPKSTVSWPVKMDVSDAGCEEITDDCHHLEFRFSSGVVAKLGKKPDGALIPELEGRCQGPEIA